MTRECLLLVAFVQEHEKYVFDEGSPERSLMAGR